MALNQTEQKIVDSTNRAVLKYTGISTGDDVTNQVLVDVSTLAFALNTSGKIMVSNTNPLPFYGTSVKRVSGFIKTGGYIKIQWKSNSNNEILVVGGTSSFDFPQDQGGQGVSIANPNNPTQDANTNGDILISTYGMQANDVYTLLIDLKKDNRYYDAGQTADPVAFNANWRI